MPLHGSTQGSHSKVVNSDIGAMVVQSRSAQKAWPPYEVEMHERSACLTVGENESDSVDHKQEDAVPARPITESILSCDSLTVESTSILIPRPDRYVRVSFGRECPAGAWPVPISSSSADEMGHMERVLSAV